jgi:hypothetical protein
LKKAWTRGSNSIFTVLTKDDFFLITNTVSLIFLFVGTQIVAIYDGGYNFLNSETTTLVAFHIVLMVYTIALTIIPAHIARYETQQFNLRLMTTREKVSTKIAPALQAISESLNVLKKPTALRAVYLDPSFQENIGKITSACSEAMSNTESFTDVNAPAVASSNMTTQSIDGLESANSSNIIDKNYWDQFELSEFNYSEQESEDIIF